MKVEIDIDDRLYELLIQHNRSHPSPSISEDICMAIADHILEWDDDLSEDDENYLAQKGSWR